MDIDPGLVGTTFVAMLFIVPFLAILAVLWWREWREQRKSGELARGRQE